MQAISLTESPSVPADGLPSLTPSERQASYQRLMLAQMGITAWVGQHQPTENFIPEQIFAQNWVNNASFTQNPTRVSNQEFPLPTHTSPVLIDNIPHIATEQPHSHLADTPALSQVIYTPNPPPIPAIRWAMQAIKIHDWIVVVDSSFLQHYPKAAHLWQHIAHNLGARVHEFRYPMLSDSHASAFINTPLLAQASFSGFICAVQRADRGSGEMGFEMNYANDDVGQSFSQHSPNAQPVSQKIGTLTPLPEQFEDERVTRLPYLSEMLEDYRQKRQFWQVIIANVSQNAT